MVGFVRESSEEGRVSDQSKVKTPVNDSGNHKFNFDSFSPELDELPFTSYQTFIDFDAVKDWIEEMQDHEKEEADRVEIGGELSVDQCSKNTVDECLIDFIPSINEKDQENSSCMKVECGDINENVVDHEIKVNQDNSMIKLDCANNCSKDKLGKVEPAEICCDGDNGELKALHVDKPGYEVPSDMVESLGCSIEEGLKKVSLGGGALGLVVTARDTKDTNFVHVNDEDDNDGSTESESESETSSSSSSSESDSGEEEQEEDKEKQQSCKIKIDNTEEIVEVEEGEITGADAENMVSWSDNDVNDKEENDSEDFEDVNDDDVLTVGPIKSKNELLDLPPVPPVNVTLEPCHVMVPVGLVLSILGSQVIIEGSEKHDPLNEGSILWIAEKRLSLGLVDEIFGPVKTPYYIVRYNSEAEVPAGIQIGTPVGFVPEFVDHVLNNKSLYQKGYDTSGQNDEEVLSETEFSDDEKETKYKREMKMSKRGNCNDNKNQGSRNKKKNRRDPKRQDNMTCTKDQPSSASPAQTVQLSQPSNQKQPNMSARDNMAWPKDQPSSAPQAQTVQPSQQSTQKQPNMSAPLPSSSSQGSQPGPYGATAFPQQVQVPSGAFPQQVQVPSGAFPQQVQVPSGAFPQQVQVPSGAFPQQVQVPSGVFPQQVQVPSGTFPHQVQVPSGQQLQVPAGMLLNSVLPFQQPNMGFPTGYEIDGMPWIPQQNSLQMPLMNPTPWQPQQFFPQFPISNAAPSQQPFDFSAYGMPNSPWPGLLAPYIAAANLSAQLPMYQGMQPNVGAQAGQNFNSQPATSFSQNMGAQAGQNFNSQPATNFPQNMGAQAGQNFNVGAHPQFNRGSSSNAGRGRRSFQQRGGGGRFGGGRGRQQSN